ncbi:outer membrane beta-barrel protein [Phreatobacter oligotrophus]|uniref:Putative OmpL-like beta-barrel porin-2 n=1 Tax=Phreatobacter oligotrophus TaxID=1122261 RepID=A0A2T4YXX7_9HYPH|nr:outer membrane beta-barrel protein [Phreatobacter oligotrophus]PTM51371.1 putative OmpL-like beta-barrel porin-2 [Phreatobacter oligotrophus]
MRPPHVSLMALLAAIMAPSGLAHGAPADARGQAACPSGGDPYQTYGCLAPYLGDNVVERFFRYHKLVWGRDSAPSDPNAPPARRQIWPATPHSTPPMPFTEWPYGGATSIGVTRPNSVDSPFMNAIANTPVGRALRDSHIQIYGWLNVGGNVSSNSVRGGNAPAAYLYNPNTVQLDQAVVYIERLPDTVQKDRIDWGFRIAPIFGTNYRYTSAYGLFSGQLLQRNNNYGYDIPMAYGELFIPQIAEGLLIRFGRYISLPDIEAQLAPNNYMYSHSMTYTFDNYTNTGINGTLALTRNWFVQLGLSVGTDTMPWNMGQRVFNPFPNALYPGPTFKKDPGAQPSVTAGVRWTSDSGNDSVYAVANGINGGQWGYNNLQWFGLTYYHKFNAEWHIAFETYRMYQRGVANANNPAMVAAYLAGGMPQSQPFNAPGMAFCATATQLSCNASVQTYLAYVNYRPSTMDNVTLRLEFFDDRQGQRTGVKSRYVNTGLGWQHWFSPQLEIRPEVAVYWSLDGRALNGNGNLGIAPTRSRAIIGSMDMILHF